MAVGSGSCAGILRNRVALGPAPQCHPWPTHLRHHGSICCQVFSPEWQVRRNSRIGGALACAAATALMALTKTVHPPAGATALLAVVDQGMLDLGWFLVPVVLLSCALMLAVALVLNNMERQFPIYWWTPEARVSGGSVFLRRTTTKAVESNDDCSNENAVVDSGETNDVEANVPAATAVTYLEAEQVIIKRGQIIVPEHMFITQEEELLLEEMCYRL